ncbi:hypothetical protein [Piscinibacter terrae]|uniref:DUF3617 family protein n=1 Tax=Piscinibacter terrae TaxID=2496871 RepID=A0A3N7HJQ1_9BURK|nr:hypothetical protein [Albitalea terrae]RQP22300.1 hypothetical protein DZC73_21815 [Albitalea terrae]
MQNTTSLKSTFMAGVGAALLVCLQPAIAADDDPQLLGCWRLQEQRYVFADGHAGRGNNDCVVEYSPGRITGRCHFGAGQDTTTEHTWTLAKPGVIHLTDVSMPDVHYRIEGDWLVSSQDTPAAPAGSQPRPVRAERIAVREGPACMPRGDQHLRSGKGPTSSLALHAPKGWTARPEAQIPAAPGMLVGLFTNDSQHPVVVTVADLLLSDSGPLQPADFGTLRSDAKKDRELTIRCDEPQRLCAIRQSADGFKAYQEVFVLRGRPVMVIASGKDATESQWREAATLFAQTLRADNAAPNR